MTAVLRKTIPDTQQLLKWAEHATPRDWRIYHIGDLARDRIGNRELGKMADIVLVLQRTNYVSVSQHRLRLATVKGWAYVATRTGAGYAPEAVMDCSLSAQQYRALVAIANTREGRSNLSVTRAVRTEIGGSDAISDALVQSLRKKGYLEQQLDGSVVVTTKGARALA